MVKFYVHKCSHLKCINSGTRILKAVNHTANYSCAQFSRETPFSKHDLLIYSRLHCCYNNKASMDFDWDNFQRTVMCMRDAIRWVIGIFWSINDSQCTLMKHAESLTYNRWPLGCARLVLGSVEVECLLFGRQITSYRFLRPAEQTLC